MQLQKSLSFLFFLNDPATPEIYPLSLHDALPISAARFAAFLLAARRDWRRTGPAGGAARPGRARRGHRGFTRPHRGTGYLRDRRCHTATLEDRKSTRLNSSHQIISYAVFCLKKKK